MAGDAFISKGMDVVVGLIFLLILGGVTTEIALSDNVSALALLAMGFLDVLYVVGLLRHLATLVSQ
ncbi:MAG: hypothetical protein HYT80_06195 [Euryarchaeota archaeon]|nr:hypothetical protein [Euryarchaeota archaeon]